MASSNWLYIAMNFAIVLALLGGVLYVLKRMQSGNLLGNAQRKMRIIEAISVAPRVGVPLKAMCSRKCAIPFWSARSCRPPAVTQMPADADRRPGMFSVTMRKPLERVVIFRLNARSFRG